jgi:hypothetical protein
MRFLTGACFALLVAFAGPATTPARADTCARLCAWKYPELECWFNWDGSHDCVKTKETCGAFKWYCASKSPTHSPNASNKVDWHVFGEVIQTASSAPRGSKPVYITPKRRP